MKIYQTVPNPYLDANQYVMTLMDGIDNLHNDVEWGWGVEKFWMSDIFDYDIIHIHWPEALLWYNRTPMQVDKRLLKLKGFGKKIVSTCHNMEPHYCSDINRNDIYDIVYRKSDMILHLENYSKEIMKEKYPNVKQMLLPHHTYDTIYHSIPNREEACRKLCLNPKYRYVICFGAFRDDEERLMVKNVANKLRNKGVFFIAPAYKSLEEHNYYDWVLHRCEKIKYHYYDHIIMSGKTQNPVTVSMTPYYYAVADIALIQRKKILNSGNVPLAFLMKKVVVGPDSGNVGLLLKESGNPTFDVNDDNSVLEAINRGFELSKENYGEKNYNYAVSHFSTAIISEQLYDIYISLNKDKIR